MELVAKILGPLLAAHRRLEAIEYGFVVPVFFIARGLRFDLDALPNRPSAFLKVQRSSLPWWS